MNSTKTSLEAQNLFQVNSFNGDVKLKDSAKSLDYEAGKTYDIYMYLFDVVNGKNIGGDDNQFHLRINILDSNDNSPVFSSSYFQVSIYENVTVGSLVTKVTATDKDGEANGKLKYFIMTNFYGSQFIINSTTGQIFLAAKLDYEEKIDKFPITICANDSSVDLLQTEKG